MEATEWPRAVIDDQYVDYIGFLLEHAIDLMGLPTWFSRSEWDY